VNTFGSSHAGLKRTESRRRKKVKANIKVKVKPKSRRPASMADKSVRSVSTRTAKPFDRRPADPEWTTPSRTRCGHFVSSGRD
jgi:hypothetical protein